MSPALATAARLGLALLLGLSACRSREQTVTVFAAASLAEPFRAMEAPFEAAHPGVDLELHFAGSQLLATQLREGARAQLFASADAAQLERAGERRELSGRATFATNAIAVVVPSDSTLEGVADLAEPGVRVALAHAEVPAGRYAREALDALELREAVEANAIASATDVHGVIAVLRLGEADAGLAYRTDLGEDGSLRALPLPASAGVVARYELARIANGGAAHPADRAAEQFADFVLGAEGQAILRDAGFGPPP
ncbi:molybdenum ABC transporter, periplasmic molybdate-binding protein [Plesiocystis pacifica SIR-1]|uniref:Molybdenum ABC transporter, periplasmic molybdate-binding protein n=1 Tax=Plesiocystis pacifica SIR-1 TaxID=391625 RepID=A6GF39_9BACT|nr:molybdate ABC transporter substrate-binding protein [Plesiocystis pacifica]EDM75498.1 molybdenum ABC transporter, periplasmic molybdate-binding protein [Plesiocystis pacifica SIR-1]